MFSSCANRTASSLSPVLLSGCIPSEDMPALTASGIEVDGGMPSSGFKVGWVGYGYWDSSRCLYIPWLEVKSNLWRDPPTAASKLCSLRRLVRASQPGTVVTHAHLT